jgi:hypothetical protein
MNTSPGQHAFTAAHLLVWGICISDGTSSSSTCWQSLGLHQAPCQHPATLAESHGWQGLDQRERCSRSMCCSRSSKPNETTPASSLSFNRANKVVRVAGSVRLEQVTLVGLTAAVLQPWAWPLWLYVHGVPASLQPAGFKPWNSPGKQIIGICSHQCHQKASLDPWYGLPVTQPDCTHTASCTPCIHTG